MLGDALTKGKGKVKEKVKVKDSKSKDDKGKGKGWKSKGKGNGAKRQDSQDSSEKECFHCDRTGHSKGDSQQRVDDMRKAASAGRPFLDKSDKVASLQTSEETPLVASITLAPDFDGYLFAITMDSDFGDEFPSPDSWSDTLYLLVRPPTALARRRANTTPMSHGLSVFLLIDSGSAVTSCLDDW